jgi:hypothetical protein
VGKLAVQYCVLTKFVRQYGQPVASDLHHVTTVQAVPGHVEFPCASGQMELFVRFFATDLQPTKVRVTIDWAGGVYTQRVYKAVGDVNLRPVAGSAVLDRTYKLVRLSYPGEGVYTIRLWRTVKSWRGRGWRRMAVEYFWVERSP